MSPLKAEALSPIDEDLNQLERDIRAFKIEYEQYFSGGRPRPPADTEWRIDQVMKRFGERNLQVSYAQRFRFNNLNQTYAKFREIFRKRYKQREEGTVQHHYGAAARKIEAERAQKQSAAPPPPTPAHKASQRTEEVVISFTDPAQQKDEMEKLYLEFRNALRQAGDTAKVPDRAQFLEFIQRKTSDLRKGKGGGQVEYAVSVENGKARLKARLKK